MTASPRGIEKQRLRSPANRSDLRYELREWQRFFRSESHVLKKHPGLIYTQAANQPDGTVSAIAARIKENGRPWLRWTTKSNSRSALQMTISAHNSAVRACRASHDGTRILSASSDGTLKLSDADTGAELMVYTGHSGPVTTCDYSPDESTVLSGSEDGSLRFWRAWSGEPLPIVPQHGAPVRACSWSRKGDRIVSGGDDCALRLWDPANGRNLRELKGHNGEVLDCVFSPDGRLIASGSADKTVRIWDSTTGSLRATLEGHQGAVRTCVFSTDGKRLLSGAGFVAAKAFFTFAEVMELAVWDVLSAVSDEKIAPLVMSRPSWAEPGASVASLLSFFDSRVSSTKAVAETAQTAKSLATTPDRELHEGGILSATFSPDGNRVLSASADATLRLWDASTLACLGTFSGHRGPVNSCSWSSAGDLVVSGCEDGTLKVWDVSLADAAPRGTPRKLEHVSYRLTADGRTLATGAAVNQIVGLIVLSDTASGNELAMLTGHEYCAVVSDFSPNGRRLLSRAILRGPPLLWDVPTKKRAATLGPQGEVTHCSFSPDGRLILVAEQTLSLWDTGTGGEVRKLDGHPAPTISCGFAPDGTEVFAVGGDKSVRFWEVTTGKALQTWSGVTGVFAYDPDGKRILCADAERGVCVREFKTGTVLVAFSDAIPPCAFASDGKRIVTVSATGKLTVHDADTGDDIVALVGHTGRVVSCAFSPDGRRMLSSSKDETARIWDADTGQELARWYLPDGVAMAQWSPTGHSILLADSAGRSYALSLQNMPVEPPVVTAWRERGKPRGLLRRLQSVHFGCPSCRRWDAVPYAALGSKRDCSHCGVMLRFSSFVMAADWRSIAAAWAD